MRKTADITITDENRDKGKTFRLTELSASAAEDWAVRAFLAIAKGVDLPETMPRSIATIGILGFRTVLGGMSYADAKPLLDQMWTCVQVLTSAGIARSPQEEDIEEPLTRLRLRQEVFELHTGFFARVAALKATLSPQDSATPPNSSAA